MNLSDERIGVMSESAVQLISLALEIIQCCVGLMVGVRCEVAMGVLECWNVSDFWQKSFYCAHE